MPSPLATTLFTWAAIYAYAGGFYCILHVRRPTHREYLAFGLACFGLTAWTVGSAIGVDAHSLEGGAFAVRLAYVGAFAATAFFGDFAAHVAGRRHHRAVLVGYVVCGVAILADVAGLLVDASRRAPAPELGLTFAPARIEPELTNLGSALVLAALVLAAYGVWLTQRIARRQRELRPLVWAGALVVVAGVHDALARLFDVHTLYLLEHAGLLQVLAISWLLLRRFVKATDELGRRTDELRRSYGELRVMQDELVRKEQLAAVGELSAVIAHEVRNPLAIIKNAVSSLRRPTLRPTDRGVLLGILDEEVDRLNRLVRDLLAYARPVEPRGRPVELARIIDEAVTGSLKNHDDPSTLGIELAIASAATIHGDPDLLRQALANVVDNALSAMPAGGTLTVSAEPTRFRGRAAVAIECVDTGEGMDSLVLGKARDPFFTTRAAGTGLGLAIVERVVKNHGGVLSIESAPGEGTAVRIVLPMQRPSSVPPPEDEP